MDNNKRAVKGAMLIDIVKAIRSMKNEKLNESLSTEARNLVSQRILPSIWYPFEPFLSCLCALYKIAGNSNPDAAKFWGKVNGRKTFETTYKSIFAGQSDSSRTLKKFEYIARSSFIEDVKEI